MTPADLEVMWFFAAHDLQIVGAPGHARGLEVGGPFWVKEMQVGWGGVGGSGKPNFLKHLQK